MRIITGVIGTVFSTVMVIFAFLSPISAAHVTSGVIFASFAFAVITLMASAFAFRFPIVSFIIMYLNWVYALVMVKYYHGAPTVIDMLGFALIPSLLILLNVLFKTKKSEADEGKRMS